MCRVYSALFSSANEGPVAQASVRRAVLWEPGTVEIRGQLDRLDRRALLFWRCSLHVPFDKYVFCEEDPRKTVTLCRFRVGASLLLQPTSPYVPGDCDTTHVAEILAAIPSAFQERIQYSTSLLSSDPFDIGLKFATLRRLSTQYYVDFLVLLAVYIRTHSAPNRTIRHGRPSKGRPVVWGPPSGVSAGQRLERNGVGIPEFLSCGVRGEHGDVGISSPRRFHSMQRNRSDYEKNLPSYCGCDCSRVTSLAHALLGSGISKYSVSTNRICSHEA